jgi:HD superfamily phosphohydrolase
MVKRIYDEVHGFIELVDEFKEIVDTPLFQRLRRIKQTSLAYMVYPGATHSRFSHSLGSFSILSRLAEKGNITTDYSIRELRVAALIHDIGQYPFSHAVEGYYIQKNRDQGSNRFLSVFLTSYTEIQDILNDYSINTRKVRDILLGEDDLSVAIDNGVDVDRMDYLIRDSKHTGVALGNIDLDRLTTTIKFQDSMCLVSEKGIHALENFYISRLHMYQAVYYHKTILGYELLLRRIFQDLISECCPELSDVKGIQDMIQGGDFYTWDDEWIYWKLYETLKSEQSPSWLKRLITQFLSRKGPKVVLDLTSYSNRENSGSSIERLLEKRDFLEKVGIPGESIYIFQDKIRILDRNKIAIDTPSGLVELTNYPNTILNTIPSSLTISRLYVDYDYAKKARDALR